MHVAELSEMTRHEPAWLKAITGCCLLFSEPLFICLPKDGLKDLVVSADLLCLLVICGHEPALSQGLQWLQLYKDPIIYLVWPPLHLPNLHLIPTARSIPLGYQQEALALPWVRHVKSNSSAQAGLSTMTATAFASLIAQGAVHDAVSQSAFFKQAHTPVP